MEFHYEVFDLDHSYCAPCDEYFVDLKSRARHIQSSITHPQCRVCERRFLNKNTLRVHYINAPYHHYCVACDKLFATAAGFQVHIDRSPMHNDDSDDEENYKEGEDGWEDELGTEVYPDGVGPEEREYSTGPGGFEEYEAFDDYDFEDLEELADPPFEFGDNEDEDTDDEDTKEQFECPMCEKGDKPVCSTKCGHLFCVPCIKAAYHYTGACPICDEEGKAEELRRVFITCT
ncbi:ring u-box domain-containing protein [Moniliophthora roreri MCA 2997]|uniref:Ring u-box domain-containing protein n=1 Tax=Moniliophthora roreri (strain MCA 2997) TaxID=1381753 RepID=V2X4H7_MONRO|nr:ring u-box domain-containing protein [Moniliophthora roreri MCA 2997]